MRGKLLVLSVPIGLPSDIVEADRNCRIYQVIIAWQSTKTI
jgi:hypothetical protein